MGTEPTGRYGVLGDPGRCVPAPDLPKGVVRVANAEQRESTLQKLIADTGCTLTEIISPAIPKNGKLVAAGRETAHIIYSRGDNIARASELLRGKEFIVVATERRAL